MESLLSVIALCLAAGMAMPIGAVLAKFEHFHQDWLEQELRHTVIAFGGGALLSAVGLVLVPQATPYLSVYGALIALLAGATAFMAIDVYLVAKQTPASQLVAMLMDFVPESLALGAIIALDGNNAYLLAGLMALQNLPEGFNAYRELGQSIGFKPGKTLALFVLMALTGPLAGVVGFMWLSSYFTVVAAVMMFAAGGILYSVFQDIAPQVPLKKHWFPPIGAVMGFGLGVLGHMLVH